MRRLTLCFAVAMTVAVSSNAWADEPAAPATPAAPAPAPVASADDMAIAAKQFEVGKQSFKAKKFVQAALAFESAAAHRLHGQAFYSAALAWMEADRPTNAADDLTHALAVEGLSPQETEKARAQLSSLELTMGTLAVTAPSPGWIVQIDGQSESAAPAHLHGTAGVHSLTVRAPDKPIERRDVNMPLGATTNLELKDAPPPKVDAPPPPPAPPPAPVIVSVKEPQGQQLRRAVGFGAIGLGVAAFASAGILGVQALDSRTVYNASPTQAAVSHTQALQLWTNVMLISGVVLGAGGALLVIWPFSSGEAKAEPKVALSPTLGGLLLSGRFQ